MCNNNESKANKNKSSNWGSICFYFLWGLFFLLLLGSMFYFHYKVPNGNTIQLNLDGPINTINSINENIISKINDGLREDINHLREFINLITSVIALFGILITAISIFFSLRESARVDNLLNQFDKKILEYNHKIENKLNDADEKISEYKLRIEKEMSNVDELNKKMRGLLEIFNDSDRKNKGNIDPIDPENAKENDYNDLHDEKNKNNKIFDKD